MGRQRMQGVHLSGGTLRGGNPGVRYTKKGVPHPEIVDKYVRRIADLCEKERKFFSTGTSDHQAKEASQFTQPGQLEEAESEILDEKNPVSPLDRGQK